MKCFERGIPLTQTEYKGLLHLHADPEQWLKESLANKISSRRQALMYKWKQRLQDDPEVDSYPANEDALITFILARPDYQTRLQYDASLPIPEEINRVHEHRHGEHTPGPDIVTFCPTGIDISDIDCACLLAYIQDIDEWIYGALVGCYSKGIKLMIREWQPILMADPDVSTIPATEEGLINMIVARDDYQSRNN